MEQTMMVSRETQELLKENNALRQRVRMLEAQLEDERSRKDAYAHVAHKHFAERLRGYGRRVWHAELREDSPAASNPVENGRASPVALSLVANGRKDRAVSDLVQRARVDSGQGVKAQRCHRKWLDAPEARNSSRPRRRPIIRRPARIT